MKLFYKSIFIVCTSLLFTNCEDDDTKMKKEEDKKSSEFSTDFKKVSEINVTDQGVPEISAYDKETQLVFSTNTEGKKVEVIDISDIDNPKLKTDIDITPFGGNLNSVAVQNGLLAIAIEGEDKAVNLGKIVVYKTNNLTTPFINVEAGFLPDMVTFTPDGKYILSANEGEPNDTNTIDPKGSITLLNIETKEATTLDFTSFNSQEAALKEKGFRVFGETNGVKNALDVDIEPEYIAVADDSKTAYIALQENNGIAVLDLESKSFTSILALGAKDYNNFKFDLSDKDDTFQLNTWNVKSFYQPDAIDYFSVNGTGYIITANEGDARDYDGFSEEVRVEDLDLDPSVYPNATELKMKQNLGRLKVTTVNGDEDGDGLYEQIYGYGARSFSIWSTSGALVYDSGNLLTTKTNELGSYPENRSDDKGTEPEAVVTYSTNNNTYAFIGLERSGDVFIFNITNPNSPVFMKSLKNTSPEGLLIVPATDSPNGKDLLIVSNEFPDKEFVIDDMEGGEFGKLVIYSN